LTFRRGRLDSRAVPSKSFMERSTLAFQVNDMNCGHCAGAITKAMKSVEHAAGVTID